MNKNLQSPTKLTEFAPLQQEEKPQSVGQYLSKFFKITKPEEPSGSATQDSVTTKEASESPDSAVSNAYSATEGRSLPNVLKRISTLLALKSNNLRNYDDTELKQYWMPDSVSKECYECSEKFTPFRRRHHCRVCGQIFCFQCCNQQIPGKIFGCTEDLRVCTYCCKVVLSYLQSSNLGDNLSTDLKLLQKSLQSKFGDSLGNLLPSDLSPNPKYSSLENVDSSKRKISVGYQEEKFASGSPVTYLTTEEKCKALQNSVSLRNLFEEICKPTTGVTFAPYKYRLRTYPECFLGSELVDWLICQQKAKTRVQAAALCQALLEGSYIESFSEPSVFVDGYMRYRKGNLFTSNLGQLSPNVEISAQEEPSWVQQIPHESSNTDSDNEQLSPSLTGLSISNSYMLDLNVEASSVYLSRPTDLVFSVQEQESGEKQQCEHEETTIVRPSEQRELAPESGWFHASNLREENGEKEAYELLSETYDQHEQSLLQQLLSVRGLSDSWSDVLLPLAHDIVSVIRPDKNHDAIELDIRNYVQFKKLPGGLKKDSLLVSGIVCSKHVAHKEMATEIENPKILLLQCSIVYQRTEGRLMSLEPVLMQEHEYLRHVAARIVALQPDVVLVHKNVSRLAQDMIRQNDITLVHNVKQSILDRLARCTQADIVTAVDAHIGRPKLGTCKRFHSKTFDLEGGAIKTLMFFEGLPCPWLGATVLLRGASKQELVRVKKVASFLVFTAYNWRLEKSFLMDEFALPPNSKMEFFDESRENSPQSLKPKASIENLIDDSTKPTPHTPADTKKPLRTKPKTDPANEDTNAFTDPLQSTDHKKITVESINDNSDPLHSTLPYDSATCNDSDELFTVSELPFSNNFKKHLDDAILCLSPYIIFPVPYLETDGGKKCKLRKFFCKDMYYSGQFENGAKNNRWRNVEGDGVVGVSQSNENHVASLHPFLTAKITNVDSNDVQNMLANFRACGGRYPKKETLNVGPNDEQKTPVPDQNAEKSRADVLDPANHQKLAVLFCSFSHESNNAPAFCVNPWVVFMDFYGRNDIPIGCFLERYCFRSSYACPSKSCVTPMVKHIRRFVHNSGCVTISLNNFESEFPEENIVMWSWCTKCQSVSPVVPMSADTWSYSFAKYLELRFYGDIFNRRGQSPCRHSLHHDHYHYFGYKNYVASFKYSSINIWEISLPPPLVEILYDTASLHDFLVDEARVLSQKGHETFSVIQDKLSIIPGEELPEGVAGNVVRQSLAKEQAQFKQKMEELQLKLTSPTVESKEFDQKEVLRAKWKIQDNITRAKISLAESVEKWNVHLTEAIRSDKKKEKSSVSEMESPAAEVAEFRPMADVKVKDPLEMEKGKMLYLTHVESVFSALDGLPELCFASFVQLPSRAEKDHFPHLLGDNVEDVSSKCQLDGSYQSQFEESPDNKKEQAKKSEKSVKNILDKLLPSSGQLIFIQNPFPPQEHYTPLFSGVYGPIIVNESEVSSIIAFALNSYEYKKTMEELKNKRPSCTEQTPSPLSKRRPQPDKDRSDTEDKTSGLLGFLRTKDTPVGDVEKEPAEQQSVGVDKPQEDQKKTKNSHIEVQFQDGTCEFFCKVYLADKFAALRAAVLPSGEEAFIRSLSRSVQWKARGGKSGSNFAKSLDMSKTEVQLFLESASNYFAYMQKCYTTSKSILLEKNLDDRFILKDMSKTEVQLFLESASNYFAYMQKCYTTSKLILLEKNVQLFLESASNYFAYMQKCYTTSQSILLEKNLDDRFILKDMSKTEVQLFLESASNYFAYMQKCYTTSQPTLLGKILGIYQITYKNNSNVTHRSHMLVMENLFYNRDVSQKFDLKGSMRNRMVVPDNQEGEIVLLDENLIKMTCDNPLYVLPHSKEVLLAAIQNDTEFLSTQSVMDYSLLVGLDTKNRELVLGIIDYIRTFTWDKRLETMVKRSGILGGQGKLPTIISPEEYQKRFIEAMHKYFLEVPDHYAGLGKGLEV